MPRTSIAFFTKQRAPDADAGFHIPRIVKGRRVWDVEELDLAFKTLPREGQGEELIFVAASSDSRGDYQ